MSNSRVVRRRATTVLALVGLFMSVAVIAAPPPASAASITYTYEVRGRGNSTSLEDFATRAAQTFADGRGWGLGGSIRFVRVASGGSFTLWLSAPQHLPAFSSGCSTTYSCRVGRHVIINEARFRGGTSAWNAARGSLRDYQHMVVNHETGHWLGNGHASCPAAGQPAPVMQQQSKGLQGCKPNPWPTSAERSALSRRTGAPIVVAPPKPAGPPPVAAGAVLKVPVAGAAGTGVPAGAVAVGVNVTVTAPARAGYATVYPCGTALPPTSNVNFAQGQTVAAFTLAKPAADGTVCIRTSQTAHIVVDGSGYVPAGAGYLPATPTRLLDTRTGGGRPGGAVSVAVPAGSAAAALTITATQPQSRGHITVHPCGVAAPVASTLNFAPGQTVANLSLAQAGTDGRVCITPNVATHIVVDMVGTFPEGSAFTAQSPRRLVDSRSAALRGGTTAVALPGSGAHVLNLTVTGPPGQGYARVYPCGAAQPTASNINFARGQTVANAVIANPGADGRVCIARSGPAHIILDDGGRLDPAEYRAVPAVRLLDTRTR